MLVGTTASPIIWLLRHSVFHNLFKFAVREKCFIYTSLNENIVFLFTSGLKLVNLVVAEAAFTLTIFFFKEFSMFIVTVYLISIFKIIFNSYNSTIFIHSTFYLHHDQWLVSKRADYLSFFCSRLNFKLYHLQVTLKG